MGVYETKNLIRPDADVGQNLDLFIRKETRNLYWNRIFSDKMDDSHGDYVFFEREKTNSPKQFFPSHSLRSTYFTSHPLIISVDVSIAGIDV